MLIRTTLTILFAMFAQVASAQQGLVFSVSNEFGGFYQPGRWYPVTVAIQNQPQEGSPGDSQFDFRGRLVIRTKSMKEGSSGFEFEREVEVPGYSTQRFTLFAKFPENLPTAPELEIRSNTGQLLQRIPLEIQPASPDKLIMATVSDQMRRVSLPSLRRADLNPYIQATVPARALPEFWAGYDPADILIFPQWPDTQLRPLQEEALRDWVAMGGTLIFLGGTASGSYATAGETELLPVRTNTSSRVNYYGTPEAGYVAKVPEDFELGDDDRSALVSNLTVEPGSEVILDLGQDESIPILVRKQIGNGQVLFCAVDFQGVHSDIRNAILPSWLGAMPLPNMVNWEIQLSDALGKLRTLTGRAGQPPSIVIIILICVLYTLVVGPVNFYFLSKSNRVQWAWFTVPIIVVTFSALIYTMGSLTKGGQSIEREITLLEGTINQRQFHENGYISIFTPSADQYAAIPVHPKLTASDAERWHQYPDFLSFLYFGSLAQSSGGFGLQGSTPKITTTDSSLGVSSWRLRTFDTTQFEVRGPRTLPGALTGSVEYKMQGSEFWFEGTLRNETGRAFYGAALAIGGYAIYLGEVGDGEEITLNRQKTQGVLANRKSGEWNSVRQTIDDLTNQTDAGRDADENVSRFNAREILNRYFSPDNTGRVLPPNNGKLLFIGLHESPEISVETGRPRDFGTRAEVVIVNLQPQNPNFAMYPQRFNQVRLHAFNPQGRTFSFGGVTSEVDNMLDIENSRGVFTVRSPFRDPSFSPKRIMNTSEITLNPRSAQVLQASAYNYRTGREFVFPTNGTLAENTSSIVTPYSGTAWITFVAEEDEQKKNQAGFGVGSQEVTVEKVGFTLLP